MPEASSRVGCSLVNLATLRIATVDHHGHTEKAVDSGVHSEGRWRPSQTFHQLQVLISEALLCADLSVTCRLWTLMSPAMTVILVGVELTVIIFVIVIVIVIVIVVVMIVVEL
jgi:hypothetical protein